MFRAPFYGICQEEVGINWIIVSTTVVIIGTASRRINIFPASSTFAAIEVRLASFMTLLPNSVIYEIQIIFKMVSINTEFNCAFFHNDCIIYRKFVVYVIRVKYCVVI